YGLVGWGGVADHLAELDQRVVQGRIVGDTVGITELARGAERIDRCKGDEQRGNRRVYDAHGQATSLKRLAELIHKQSRRHGDGGGERPPPPFVDEHSLAPDD